MLRITHEKQEQAAKILEIVCRERAARYDEANSIARLSEAIREMWELWGIDDPRSRGQKSAALRKAISVEGVIDHPVPQTHLAKMLLSMPKADYRVPYVSNLLHKFAFFCFITPEEKMRLIQAGIADRMPKSWNRIDRFARYANVGISMGEIETLNGEELRQLLSDPPAPFYVYRLRTPAGKVFYIGEGERFRALSHEKEIFNRSYRTHTNWKKLNKIAQIIYSGKELVYEIESWHIEKVQACLREDELILMAERENPWTLANSNGSRWSGKPSRQLCEVRKGRGLDT